MVSDAATNFQSRMDAHASSVHINHFAQDVTYTPYSTGVNATIQAVVLIGEDVSYQEYDDGQSLVEQVSILVATSQLASAAEGDKFVPSAGPAATRTYKVVGRPESDGHGMLRILGQRYVEVSKTTGNYFGSLRQ